MNRRGITLLELIVVIGIIGLLIALTLPAIHAARETSRRTQCGSNLHQIGAAIHSYSVDYSMFPPGSSLGFSFHATLLPYIESNELYNSINFRRSNSDPENRTVRACQLAVFTCPTDPAGSVVGFDGSFPTTYGGNFGTGVQIRGYDGMFQHLERGGVYPRDVIDGLTNTASVSEIPVSDGVAVDHRRAVFWTNSTLAFNDFIEQCETISQQSNADRWLRGRPWTHGDVGTTLYNHILGPNQNSCFNGATVPQGAYSAGSFHSGIVHVLFGDGRVSPVSVQIDRSAWRAYGSRHGFELD